MLDPPGIIGYEVEIGYSGVSNTSEDVKRES
jgi:hypothetical protein